MKRGGNKHLKLSLNVWCRRGGTEGVEQGIGTVQQDVESYLYSPIKMCTWQYYYNIQLIEHFILKYPHLSL